MIDFKKLLEVDEFGYAYNPYAGKNKKGEFVKGGTSTDFLNDNYGHLETVEDMINATDSEGLKLFFAWLRDKGILN